MKFLTADQIKGLGSDAVKVIMGIVGTLVAFKMMSAGDAAAIQSALDALSDSATKIAGIIATLITVYTTLVTVWSRSPLALMLRGSSAAAANPQAFASASIADQTVIAQATDKLPDVVGVVASPVIANAVPEETIVSPNHAKDLAQ